MLVEGDLGPAAELVGLIREAGIEVREADGYGAGRMVLPGGGTLCLTDGRLPVSKDQVHFDLALDYRAATRIALSASEGVRTGLLSEATGLFQALGKEVSVVGDVPGLIVARTVARIIDLAFDAVAKGVAAPEDVDTAMRLGVNYPLGPFNGAVGSVTPGPTTCWPTCTSGNRPDAALSLALHRHAAAAEDREGAAS
ncbi:hypothetical protein STENM223S_05950 [Streptomyces tendae]